MATQGRILGLSWMRSAPAKGVRLDGGNSATAMTLKLKRIRAPRANAYCERLIGTIRRECLDYLIPTNERHLRLILKEFVRHYNRGRPHSALDLEFRSHPRQVFRPVSIATS
jgi:hypothetical protein